MYPETDRVKGREGKELNTQLNTVDAAECVSSRARLLECKKRFSGRNTGPRLPLLGSAADGRVLLEELRPHGLDRAQVVVRGVLVRCRRLKQDELDRRRGVGRVAAERGGEAVELRLSVARVRHRAEPADDAEGAPRTLLERRRRVLELRKAQLEPAVAGKGGEARQARRGDGRAEEAQYHARRAEKDRLRFCGLLGSLWLPAQAAARPAEACRRYFFFFVSRPSRNRKPCQQFILCS